MAGRQTMAITTPRITSYPVDAPDDLRRYINLHLQPGWADADPDSLPPAIDADAVFAGPEIPVGELADVLAHQTRQAQRVGGDRFDALHLVGTQSPAGATSDNASSIADLLDPA